MKPFSAACERNKEPILAILKDAFANSKKVLGLGSGTGQHAVYFAEHLPHLIWQPSDLAENCPGIQEWVRESPLNNVLLPLELDINWTEWPIGPVDAIFSANTLHIMSWPEVKKCFAGIGKVLESQGILCIYGPFNYHGAYTSKSNEDFDAWLKNRDPESGIRAFEAVDELACDQGLQLVKDHAMPANNRLLVWKKE